jgi:tRNA-dihydrouridine synthase B
MSNKNLFDVRIGKVRCSGPVFLAPMEAVNCTAFRLMCKRYGAGLVYTPMIDVELFMKEIEEKGNIANSRFVDFVEEERPLAIQLGGAKPENFKSSAEILQDEADILDINFGCPLPYMLGKKGGAWLTKHPNMMEKVVNAVLQSTNKPVTAKIRIGWDDSSINALEVAKMLEDMGVSAVAVHGRTCKQKYTNKANWAVIKQVHEKLSIPVIGNGDIFLPGHVKFHLERDHCGAVMVGRAAKGNAYFFKRANELLRTGKNITYPSMPKQMDLIFEFMRIYEENQQRQKFTEVRDHVMWMCAGTPFARNIRSKLLKTEDLNGIARIVKSYYTRTKYIKEEDERALYQRFSQDVTANG